MNKRRIWIDIDNSPHVPFFDPIIDNLRKNGHEVIVTARDAYQVRQLMELHKLSGKFIGRHYGKNHAAKILGTVMRAAQLAPRMIGQQIDLAVSHGSRAQVMCGVGLGIPSLFILDYEFIAKMGFIRPDYILVPQMIPDSKELAPKRMLLKYPGLKEDVYVPGLRPDPTVKERLGFRDDDLMVTVRPPAIEAHYHNSESDLLLEAAMNLLMKSPGVRVVLLPRNENQARILRKAWAVGIESRKVVIPEEVVDGLNLIWFSDFVISGGGTMNREAAALGVPVYSIFRGKIGAVDRYLQQEGRLVLIESVKDVCSKIIMQRRVKNEQNLFKERPALKTIVNGIQEIAQSRSS